ncbi:hypothetical protein RhiirA4_477171 [Rhizophagus irregularis]|uniref:Protein kinase domain-containing protein n=1 Tax=Rhizophagus irregularis TaxID=588596 RepID=A0A2I1HCT4_9GLOM|nr:hypothetical protein RhiirA4_477171 [Rhizophagus irregularis]
MSFFYQLNSRTLIISGKIITPKTAYNWCQCIIQQNFKNWTSGNHEIDKFIQKAQLNYWGSFEWIEYNRFENVKYLAKGGFGTIYEL